MAGGEHHEFSRDTIEFPRYRKGRFRQRTANQEILRCTECGWELPWTEYHRSCRKKNMASLGLIEIFREFSREYPKARTYREKMLTIDRLIHRYHWELEGEAGGPAAVNLIGGTRAQIIAFLNKLTYGDESTPGLQLHKEAWLDKMNYAGWNRNTVDALSRELRSADEEDDLSNTPGQDSTSRRKQ